MKEMVRGERGWGGDGGCGRDAVRSQALGLDGHHGGHQRGYPTEASRS